MPSFDPAVGRMMAILFLSYYHEGILVQVYD